MERPALTILTEEELQFRTTVRAFADARLRPLAAEMDREGELHPDIIGWLYELGLMGIEVPEPL
ncbi:MAG: acyl-CoA dehydrogenase family protein, partial [Proteobacteria bacterium]|nr:acyl-CoA dehydrogenase family protein [Pseudomonadota bacterium]